MSTKTVDRHAKLLWAGALVCTLAGGVASASEHIITVGIHVSSAGLDLNQPADARTFYRRIEHAAKIVCKEENRGGLVRIEDYKTCYGKALSTAIRRLRNPLVTRMYLETHTLLEAEAAGIDLPAQLAVK